MYTSVYCPGKLLWKKKKTGRRFETKDPRNGEVIAEVAEGDKEDVDLAVEAARAAFDHGPWPRLSGFVIPPSSLPFNSLSL